MAPRQELNTRGERRCLRTIQQATAIRVGRREAVCEFARRVCGASSAAGLQRKRCARAAAMAYLAMTSLSAVIECVPYASLRAV